MTAPASGKSWLAPAIRDIAQKQDPKLAVKLVLELLPAQRLAVKQPLTYLIEINQFGRYLVHLDGEQTRLEKMAPSAAGPKPDFGLKGPIAAFSELAAGGTGRRLPGLRVSAGKRRARRLTRARRSPVSLAELAQAGIDVWPGLLLLATAHAIDPAWTKGQRFVIAFAIEGQQSMTIYLNVCDGQPIFLSRESTQDPHLVAHVNESSFLRLLAGMPLSEQEPVLVNGDKHLLELFLGWTDRVQGLSATE